MMKKITNTLMPETLLSLRREAGYIHPERGEGGVEQARLFELARAPGRNMKKVARKLISLGIHPQTGVLLVEGPRKSAQSGKWTWNWRVVTILAKRTHEYLGTFTRWL